MTVSSSSSSGLGTREASILAIGGSIGSLQPLLMTVLDLDVDRANVSLATGTVGLVVGLLTGVGIIPAPRGVTLFALGYATPILSSLLINALATHLVSEPLPSPARWSDTEYSFPAARSDSRT